MSWSLTTCSGARPQALAGGRTRLLEVVAVSGRPLGQADASRAALLGAGEQTALHLLRSGRLIRSTGPAERDERDRRHRRRPRSRGRPRPAESARGPPPKPPAGAGVLGPGRSRGPRHRTFIGPGNTSRARECADGRRRGAGGGDTGSSDRAAKLYRLGLGHATGGRRTCAPASGWGSRMHWRTPGCGPGGGGREYLAAAAGATVAETFEPQAAAAMQFLCHGLPRRRTRTAHAVLKAVGMTLPDTPRALSCRWSLNRTRIRLRGLHFLPARKPSQVSADDLTRIEVCWTAANGLGMIDPIRASDFQGAEPPAKRCGRVSRTGSARAILHGGELRLISWSGAASDVSPSSCEWPRRSPSRLINPISGACVCGEGCCGVYERAMEAGG